MIDEQTTTSVDIFNKTNDFQLFSVNLNFYQKTENNKLQTMYKLQHVTSFMVI